ncbi:MAG TPA: hypothetical protein VFE15_03625 [Marmoricola sp.]|jgi:hypothetical protein|nr:hypothetical protein [Marmoricola sp.]
MDGTLCDVRTIRHFVEGRRRNFHAFHSASVSCPPYPEVLEVVEAARASGLAILVVTAREARWSFHTALWLREHGIAYDEMLMRRTGDHRPDSAVKTQIARRLVRRYDPVLAVDDRTEIIAVWHRFGISSRHVDDDGRVGPIVDPGLSPGGPEKDSSTGQ